MRIFGSRETPARRAARLAFGRWAKDAIARAKPRYRAIQGSREAELFLEVLLDRPQSLDAPKLMRMYTHRDAAVLEDLFAIEAEILAERGFLPVRREPGNTRTSLGGLAILSVDRQTLTVTYERPTDDPHGASGGGPEPDAPDAPDASGATGA